MKTVKIHSIKIVTASLLIFLLHLSGCAKKCQAPATEKFKTVTGQQWRLVETTDPSPDFKALSKSTFLIFQFGVDYKGSVNLVQNNTQFDTPVKTFLYNIDVQSGEMRLKYDGAPPAEGEEATQVDKTPQSSVVEYTYDLGKELEMTDSRGNYYRFIPFTGIVAPDDTCEF